MLSVIILIAVIVSVIMLSLTLFSYCAECRKANYYHAGWHYSERCCAERRYA